MPEPSLTSIYQQLILEHYRNPRNKSELEHRTVEAYVTNPVCGDEVKIQLRLDGDTIEEVGFDGQGCSISQASVSMMTALLPGKRRVDAVRLADRFTEMMYGNEEVARDRSMGDLRALQGVSKFPVRVKCALLGFDALREALGRQRGEGTGQQRRASESRMPRKQEA